MELLLSLLPSLSLSHLLPLPGLYFALFRVGIVRVMGMGAVRYGEGAVLIRPGDFRSLGLAGGSLKIPTTTVPLAQVDAL